MIKSDEKKKKLALTFEEHFWMKNFTFLNTIEEEFSFRYKLSSMSSLVEENEQPDRPNSQPFMKTSQRWDSNHGWSCVGSSNSLPTEPQSLP